MCCFKLNGVELPCGSLLSVQPADFDYKKKNTSKKNNNQNDIKSQTRHSMKEENVIDTEPHPLEGKTDDNPEDDLDDFFSSL